MKPPVKSAEAAGKSGAESAEDGCLEVLSEATDQKAGGSNPSRRTKKLLDSEWFQGVFCMFVRIPRSFAIY